MESSLQLSKIIAEEACQLYSKLPKKGKPNSESEWTTMAAIVQETFNNNIKDNIKGTYKVVSLGTGTKCLGFNELSDKGDLVSDSHAEVTARRSFLLYIYEQLVLCKKGEDGTIFEFLNTNSDSDSNKLTNKFKLRQGVNFHIFISHSPCGDGAIIEESDAETEAPIPSKRFKSGEAEKGTDPEVKPGGHSHRTGAKLKAGPLQYEERQMSGSCRVKPGKGDPTLCMSCSDKLAKWQMLGLQGSLLSILVPEPIRLASITIGGSVPFSRVSLERAIFGRFDKTKFNSDNILLSSEYRCPEIHQSHQNFMKFTEKLTPAPASISWYFRPINGGKGDSSTENVQVLVGGRKQGATKKMFGKPSSMVEICRAKIFSRFRNLISTSMICDSGAEETSKTLTYSEAKLKSENYSKSWKLLKESVFMGWTEKPSHLQHFC